MREEMEILLTAGKIPLWMVVNQLQKTLHCVQLICSMDVGHTVQFFK